jgi:outer membrane protein assembly factor BamB
MGPRMSRRTGLVALAVLVLVALVGTGVVLLTRGPECPVELTELERDLGELVAVEELAPEGSVGEERQPTIDAIDDLDGPVGDVVAGRFYPAGTAPPVLVPFEDDVVLATAGEETGDFLAVDVPEGSVRWARGYDGGAARGGLVGTDFVVLLGGSQPAVLALDAEDGDRRSCVAVPVAGESGDAETLLTDQAGTDVVVAAGPPAAPVTLSRIAPQDGEVVWDRELPGAEAGSLTVVGGTAVVGRIETDPVRLADMAVAGGIAAPMVRAYSLEDGTESWSYPGPDEFRSTAALVVGNEPGTDDVVVLTAESGRSRSSQATVARLVALDAEGEERWTARLGSGYWNASLWGDLVVAQGAARGGGAQLRAYSLADGSFRWSLRSADLPLLGEQPRTNFGSGVAVGEDYLVPAPNGLLLIDPVSGETERLDSPVAVEQLFTAGDHLLLKTRDALLVLDDVS